MRPAGIAVLNKASPFSGAGLKFSALGGVITTVAGSILHTFLASGIFSVLQGVSVVTITVVGTADCAGVSAGLLAVTPSDYAVTVGVLSSLIVSYPA